uniref:Selenoprotein P n=1 Tax=Poecilia latipinna TaxID=48699 RepID=A0A3B3VRI7_9TELE
MVINHQGEQAQRLHPMLAERLSDKISLYKQGEQQPDVWQALNGKKDDFIIYDRCGRLTHHISLPYSVIGHGHIESAIKEAYCNRMCGASDGPAAVGDNTEHDHSRHHGHGHHGHGHHGHGHHGHGHHGHGHHGQHGHHHHRHHGDHHGHQGDLEQSQQGAGQDHGQHVFDSPQLQQAVDTEQLLQEAVAAPVRP